MARYARRKYKSRRRKGRRRTGAKGIKKIVRREISRKLEKKFNVVTSDRLNVDKTAIGFNPLDYVKPIGGLPISNPLVQGSREGDVIQPTGLRWMAKLEGADTPYNYVRLLWVRTRVKLATTSATNWNGAVVTCHAANQIFDPTYAQMGVHCSLNQDVVKGVLYDRIIKLQSSGGKGVLGAAVSSSTGLGQTTVRSGWVKFPKRCAYTPPGTTGGSSAFGESTQENIYFVMVSDSALSPDVSCTWWTKLTYTDA